MIRLGLCSVTLRRLPAAEVAQCAARAGLEAIEWGADIHAPPNAPEAVRAARQATDRYGLACASYGSYFHATPREAGRFAEVAQAAVLLGAPRVRVWAGTHGSGDVSAHERAACVASLREAAAIGADHGLELALEFHGSTLTDTHESTAELLKEVGAANLSTYWQPPLDSLDDEAVAGLSSLVDDVSAVHVFSWWPANQRLPLAARHGLWERVVVVLRNQHRPVDALLEFVPGDDAAVVVREAAALRRLAAPDAAG